MKRIISVIGFDATKNLLVDQTNSLIGVCVNHLKHIYYKKGVKVDDIELPENLKDYRIHTDCVLSLTIAHN